MRRDKDTIKRTLYHIWRGMLECAIEPLAEHPPVSEDLKVEERIALLRDRIRNFKYKCLGAALVFLLMTIWLFAGLWFISGYEQGECPAWVPMALAAPWALMLVARRIRRGNWS